MREFKDLLRQVMDEQGLKAVDVSKKTGIRASSPCRRRSRQPSENLLNEFPRRCQADDGTRTRDLKNGGSAKDDLLKTAENAKEPPRKWTEPRSRRLFFCAPSGRQGRSGNSVDLPPTHRRQHMKTSICYRPMASRKAFMQVPTHTRLGHRCCSR